MPNPLLVPKIENSVLASIPAKDYRRLLAALEPVDLNFGEVLYEAPRKVRAENGRFSDWFGPFDVHVYRFVRF